MIATTTIQRSFALACKGKYDIAEELLTSSPETLQTPHGADLYARILFATGRRESARAVWEKILEAAPDYEPARLALEAGTSGRKFKLCNLFRGYNLRRCLVAMLAVIVVIESFILTTNNRREETGAPPTPPSVILTATIPSDLMRESLQSLQKGFLTNLTEKSILLIRGGVGRYITDRQRQLAVLTECLTASTGIPSSKVYLQPAAESTNTIELLIVPPNAGIPAKVE